MADLDVRPINTDRLVRFTAAELSSRRTRIEAHLEDYEARCMTLKEDLEASERIVHFLQGERASVELAGRLQREEVVRVVCPQCKGSGMKPTDTTGGQIHKKSAFESITAPASSMLQPAIDPKDQCRECHGEKWVLMERYKG